MNVEHKKILARTQSNGLLLLLQCLRRGARVMRIRHHIQLVSILTWKAFDIFFIFFSLRIFFFAFSVFLEWGKPFSREAKIETAETNISLVLLPLFALLCYAIVCATWWIYWATTAEFFFWRNDKYHGHRRLLPQQHRLWWWLCAVHNTVFNINIVI